MAHSLDKFAAIGEVDLQSFLGIVQPVTMMPEADILQILVQSNACKVDCKSLAEWLKVSPRSPPFLEFALCGIDRSASPEAWRSALAPVEGHARQLDVLAGVQLAYQGFPWKPTPAYRPDGDPRKRRHDGLVYPPWSELEELLPRGVPMSFHLNETSECPYVSGVLRGEADMKELVRVLVHDFKACHIKINITAHGVPHELLGPDSPGVKNLREISAMHPGTTFIVPIAKIKQGGDRFINTEHFVRELLAAPAPPNICGFFDSSAGTCTEPDTVPKIPSWYCQEAIGFTGGIKPTNVREWLKKYTEAARAHGCRLISDVQCGIRVDNKRSNPTDSAALGKLAQQLREWAACEAPAKWPPGAADAERMFAKLEHVRDSCPPVTHTSTGLPFLQEGDQLSLKENLPKMLPWRGATSYGPSMVSLVGPGEADLPKLSEITHGLPWVMWGVLFAYHPLPQRVAGTDDQELSHFTYPAPGKEIEEYKLTKYPRLSVLAKWVSEKPGVRIAAHLNDEFARVLLEGTGRDLLSWIAACGFEQVQVNWSYLLKDPALTQKHDVAENLLKIMQEFHQIIFIYPLKNKAREYDKEPTTKIVNKLLEKGANNMFFLYDTSHGTGEEATTFSPPHQNVMCGYAGGLGPDNIVQKSKRIHYVVPNNAQYYVDMQSLLREAPSKENKYGRFDLEKAKAVLRNLREDSACNPSKGREIFPQPNGDLFIGPIDSNYHLKRNQEYKVVEIDRRRCRFKLEGLKDFLAGSATRFFLRRDTSEEKTSLFSCPHEVDTVLKEARRDDNYRRASSLRFRKNAALLPTQVHSCGPHYNNATPAEALKVLLADQEGMSKARETRPADECEAQDLLQKWESGRMLIYEDGIAQRGFVSIGVRGFNGRASDQPRLWAGEMEGLEARGIAAVSVPGSIKEKYNTIVKICLEDGLSLCVVWEEHWGHLWFYIWLRNMLDAYRRGYVMLVLTDSIGQLGNAQSLEVEALKFLGVPFVWMTVDDFISKCRPFHGAIQQKDLQLLTSLANKSHMEDGTEICDHLDSCRDGSGFTALTLAATTKDIPVDAVAALVGAGADPDAQDSEGRTTLHWVMRNLAKYYDKDEGKRSMELLKMLRKKCNTQIKDFYNRTPLEYYKHYAKGRTDPPEDVKQLLQESQRPAEK